MADSAGKSDAVNEEQAQAEFMRTWGPTVEKFSKKLEHLPNESVKNIPFFGKQIYRHLTANYLEAIFFFLKSGDPVVDQKLINAYAIRNYEFAFGLHSGLIFSTAFFYLPGWKGYNMRLRGVVSLIPLGLSLYRGFRRGTDQVLYVGDTYVEHQLRKRALLQHLRDYDNHMFEFKQHLLQRGDFNQMLQAYGLRPLTQV